MNELLLQQAKNGSPDAFESLVAPYEGSMWRLCWHYTGRRQDAEDCLQQAMLKAWRSLPRFRADCSTGSWLYRITVSVCTDFLRRHRHRSNASLQELKENVGFDPPDPSPGTDEQAVKNDDLRRLREAILLLPADQREALMLVALQGVSCQQAAEILDTAVGTIKSRVNRAKKELLKQMEPERSGIVKKSEVRRT